MLTRRVLVGTAESKTVDCADQADGPSQVPDRGLEVDEAVSGFLSYRRAHTDYCDD